MMDGRGKEGKKDVRKEQREKKSFFNPPHLTVEARMEVKSSIVRKSDKTVFLR